MWVLVDLDVESEGSFDLIFPETKPKSSAERGWGREEVREV